MITSLANKIMRAMVDLLGEAEKVGWHLPFYVIVCGANGGMMTGTFVDGGKGEAEFVQRSKDTEIELPFNVILVDPRGKALRLVCEEGLVRPSLREFLN